MLNCFWNVHPIVQHDNWLDISDYSYYMMRHMLPLPDTTESIPKSWYSQVVLFEISEEKFVILRIVEMTTESPLEKFTKVPDIWGNLEVIWSQIQ